MIDPKSLKARTDTILVLCKKVQNLIAKHGTDEHKAADEAFWDALTALDAEAGHGLNVGRLARLGVGDGYAFYIVAKILKNTVKLIHLPYGDCYRSPSVVDDEAYKNEIEDVIKWWDTLQEAAGKAQEKIMIRHLIDND